MAIGRVLVAGLLAMGAVALLSAIWPSVASVVGGVFIAVLGGGVLVPAVLGVRWVRGELAWRRELRAMPPAGAAAAPEGAAPVMPSLAELRETA